MIATLTGLVALKSLDTIVLDVNGVGYGLYVTSEDNGSLSTGERVMLHVYEHIREASHDLFGFVTVDTKSLFEQLLSVNGVGPKMAMSVLSIGNIDHVKNAIAGGDVRFIQRASGVGKRVAERIIVDLKDKVGLEGVELGTTGMLQSDSSILRDDAAEALMALGYSHQDAAAALAEVPKELSTEDRIKQALSKS